MIPAAFDYAVPEGLDQALAELADGGDDAKVLAGGHSLIPLMKVGLAMPTKLVDLRRVPGLRGVQANGGLRIGALTRHAELQDAGHGLLSTAAKNIADQQVRNRGTIGGSLAHGDPAADLAAVVLAMDGELVVRGPGGERTVAAGDFFVDYLTTAVGEGEILTEVRLPALDGYGHGYQKFARRAEDWAMVGVNALVRVADGRCEDVRVGLTHMAGIPLRATAVEQALRGQPPDAQTIAAAAERAADETDPPGDLNASPDYKRHLARVLCRRALEQATGLGG
jgi:aerobic carbon-monoxide dehydrogenase medium subunit